LKLIGDNAARGKLGRTGCSSLPVGYRRRGKGDRRGGYIRSDLRSIRPGTGLVPKAFNETTAEGEGDTESEPPSRPRGKHENKL
jgi:hypothetical protein